LPFWLPAVVTVVLSFTMYVHLLLAK